MMRSEATTKALTNFIIFSPRLCYLDEQSKLVELSSFLCSTKDFATLSQVACKIESPVGVYYQALSRNSTNDPNLFAVSNLQDCYLCRSFVSMAIAVRNQREPDYAFRLCLEAIKLARQWNDPIAMYQAQQQIAIIQSEKGNHPAALECLENAFPLARLIAKIRPAWYYDYLNSRAVEMTELGRLEEARRNIQIALASPYSGRYDGWHETRDELTARGQQRASRSVIPVVGWPVEKSNIEILSEHQHPSEGVPENENKTSAKLFEFKDWVKGKARMDNQQTNKKPVDANTSLEDLEYELFRELKRNPVNPSNADKYRRIIEILREREDSNVEEKP